MKIRSQRYIDQETVEQKKAAEDYEVMIATIEHDGEVYEVVIDGHHSLEAALQAGVAPEFVESDYDYQAEVDCIGFDAWLEQHWIDSDWYDISTDVDTW